MFKENSFELFLQYDDLPDKEKSAFINKLKTQNPDKAQKLLLLSQDSQNFTEHFLENIIDYSESISSPNIYIGKTFGVYTIVKLLGVGGMGHVYLAERHDGLIEQEVAIKFLHPALYQLNSTQTLLNEAQALANLNHPNIATILDVVKTDDDLIYMVMEYIEGYSLNHYLAQNKLSFKDKLKLFEVIADAVHEAHSKRIVHADIKPSNILITQSGKPKLIDFGIMQFVGMREAESNVFINQYLCAMSINYSAPEQLQGQRPTIQTDVYALGGLLYFILSGKTPFEESGGSLAEKVDTISENEIPTCPINHKIKFRNDIYWILQTCLAKRPGQRFRSVEALNSEIKNHLKNSPLAYNQNLFYRFSKSWYRHKVGYVSGFFIMALVISFASKIWHDNIQIQQSYQELSKSLFNQSYMLDEPINNKYGILLPPIESVPIELYINLAFKKFDEDFNNTSLGENRTKALKNLKKVLERNSEKYSKELLLINYRIRLFMAVNNEMDIQKYDEIYQALLKRNDVSQEEIIDIIFWRSINLSSSKINNDLSYKLLQKVKSPFIDENVSISHQIKFYKILSYHSITFGLAQNQSIEFDYSRKAFQLAMSNPKKVTTSLFFNVLQCYLISVALEFGHTKKYLDTILIAEKYVKKVPTSKRNHIISDVLILIDEAKALQSIKNIDTFYFHDTDFIATKDMQAEHFARIGDFSKASLYRQELNTRINRDSGNQSYWSKYYKREFTLLQIERGVISESLTTINEILIPFWKKNYDDSYLASYMQIFCVPLSYHIDVKSLEKFCKTPYELDKAFTGEGENKYWTEYSLSKLVWWISLSPYNESEIEYVIMLENTLDEALNIDKILNVKALLNYYVARNNIEKVSYYVELLEKTLLDYAGDIYITDIDMLQLYKADLLLLKGNQEQSIIHIEKASVKFCEFLPKNYLRMHLNQVAKKAGISKVCLGDKITNISVL